MSLSCLHLLQPWIDSSRKIKRLSQHRADSCSMMPWIDHDSLQLSESIDGNGLQHKSELTAQDCENCAIVMNPPCARGPLALHSRPEWQAGHVLPADSSICLHKRQAVPLGRGLGLASKSQFSWLSRGPLPSRRFGQKPKTVPLSPC